MINLNPLHKESKVSVDSNLLLKVVNGLGLAAIFAFPLFFLPLTTEYYIYNKFALFIMVTAIMFLLWTASFVINKQVKLTLSPFTLPLLAFMAVAIIATFAVDPNRTDALFGQTALITCLTLFHLILSSVVSHKKAFNRIFLALETTGLLMVIFAIISITGLGDFIYPLTFMKQPWWTPMGAPLNLFLFLLPLFPLTLVRGIRHRQISTIVISVFLLAGVVFSGIHLLPGKDTIPTFLPQKAGWDIALEVFKNSPFLGTGVEGFNEAFTRFRPAYLNTGDNWNLRFNISSNTYVHYLTTTGLLGFAAFMLLVFKVIRYSGKEILHSGRSADSMAIAISLLLVLFTMLFIPTNIVLLFLLYLFLTLFTLSLKLEGKEKISDSVFSLATIKQISSDSESTSVPGQIMPWILFIPSLALSLTVLYFGGKTYLAETYFFQGLKEIQENKGGEAYQHLIKAINLNPYSTSYHRTYSQINLALANSLAGKQEFSDKDKSDITLLIQQAIREGKAATTLNPANVVNWENLANIYRQLINVAQGADQWTLASYVQAIRLDPTNPNLRIQLGGVFFALKDYPRAQAQFAQAANLKTDLANAYYNLGLTYAVQKDTLNAVRALETTLSLVDKESADFLKAQSELETLRKQLTQEQEAQLSNEKTQTNSENLSRPQPLPTTALEKPVELTEEEAPEIPLDEEATEAAQPTAEPTLPEENQ